MVRWVEEIGRGEGHSQGHITGVYFGAICRRARLLWTT